MRRHQTKTADLSARRFVSIYPPLIPAQAGIQSVAKVQVLGPRLRGDERKTQLSKKLRSFLDRLGCFSLRSAFASIWRMRSRVTENCWPTSSSV